MADIREPESVKLFVGMLSARANALDDARETLVAEFGPVDLQSDDMDHHFTDYYGDEMGRPLLRRFVTFQRLIDPADLPDIKRRTNDLERRFADSARWPVARPVNLDPGYLTPAKLVLASCKDYAHRIYLRDSIYAETTLCYTRGRWHAYEWTYPDFRSEPYQAFLSRVRDRLMTQRKEGRQP